MAEDGEPTRHVTVSANPDVDYQTVLRVTDALRSTPSGQPLFDDVAFGIAR